MMDEYVSRLEVALFSATGSLAAARGRDVAIVEREGELIEAQLARLHLGPVAANAVLAREFAELGEEGVGLRCESSGR